MNSLPNRHLGALIRTARLARGLTQAELAEAVGLAQRTISHLERGEVERPHSHTLLELSKTLGIPLGDLNLAAQLAENQRLAHQLAAAQQAAEADAEAAAAAALVQRIAQLSPEVRANLMDMLAIFEKAERKRAASDEDGSPASGPAAHSMPAS